MLEGFVALPDEIKVGIAGVVLWLVSFVFAKLIALVPFLAFLEEFREPLALAIAASLVGFLENALPDAYPAIAILALQLVLAVLAAFGVAAQFKKRGFRFFQ